MRVRHLWVASALVLAAGCAGYNLQLGTSGFDTGQFFQVYTVPATSLEPWTERALARPLSLTPPPADGSSGVSSLPASGSTLPPERPMSPKTGN